MKRSPYFRPAQHRCPKCRLRTLRWTQGAAFSPPSGLRCTTEGCGWTGLRTDLQPKAVAA